MHTFTLGSGTGCEKARLSSKSGVVTILECNYSIIGLSHKFSDNLQIWYIIEHNNGSIQNS